MRRSSTGLAAAIAAVGLVSVLDVVGLPRTLTAAEPDRRITVTIESRGSATLGGGGILTATELGPPGARPRTVSRTLPDHLPAELELALGSGGSWLLSIEAPGFWCPAVVLGPQDGTARIELLPTARLDLHLLSPRGVEPPAELAGEVRPSPAREPFPSGQVICPRRDEIWRCEVPAGGVDLRLSAEGFVPIYLWSVDLQPGERKRRSAGQLRHGASVSGFVTAADGQVEGAEVRLEPLMRIPTSAERRQALSSVATVNDRGFFLLADVPPGEHAVSVHQAGYAIARSAPIHVDEQSETRLIAPLRLERPVEIQVFLLPPLDAWGKPWQVQLQGIDTTSRGATAEAHRAATEAGHWSQTGLEPGAYRLRIFDSAGSMVSQRQVEASATAPPVEIELDLVPVQGIVRRGSEPVEGRLILTGIPGVRSRRRGAVAVLEPTSNEEASEVPAIPDRRRIVLPTDPEGSFTGFLPHEGFWQPEVWPTNGERVRLLDPVEVRRPGTGEPAEIEVSIPDTRLSGVVRHRSGATAADAAVSVTEEGTGTRLASATTDTSGSFVFHGIPETPVMVEARGGGERSRAVRVELQDGDEKTLDLVLEPQVVVRGVVSSLAGPLPGVHLDLRPVGSGVPAWTSLGTDVMGRFRFPVPAGTRALDAIVVAPMLPVKVRRLPIPDEPERDVVEIRLDESGGTIHFRIEQASSLIGATLLHGGAVVELTSVVAALMPSPDVFGPDGSLTVPLAAGPYSICSQESSCQQVFLSPGQSVELTLESEQETTPSEEALR